MPPSILANLTLGYRTVWDHAREPAGVELFVDASRTNDRGAATVDGAHLLSALAQAWSADSPQAIVFVQSAPLLADVLVHASPGGAHLWIGVEDRLLSDPGVAQQLTHARARGVQLVWRGAEGMRPAAAFVAGFTHQIISLSAGEALVALHASVQQRKKNPTSGPAPVASSASPVLPGYIYEGVASRALAEHCLDDQGAWGVAGWPMDDVIQAHGHGPVQPGRHAIDLLIEATDADMALDRIEELLVEEPVLVYRLLRHANSAALGLRTGVDSLRHALMVLGLSTFRRWLVGQLPGASEDLNLQPVRTSMVIRARLMELLLDPGEEDKLRSEIFLCGLLSQIDMVLGEPIADALQRFPVSQRITDAILSRSGPYAAYLEIAIALEYPRMRDVASLCESHDIDIGDANRALLRVVSHAPAHSTFPNSRFPI